MCSLNRRVGSIQRKGHAMFQWAVCSCWTFIPTAVPVPEFKIYTSLCKAHCCWGLLPIHYQLSSGSPSHAPRILYAQNAVIARCKDTAWKLQLISCTSAPVKIFGFSMSTGNGSGDWKEILKMHNYVGPIPACSPRLSQFSLSLSLLPCPWATHCHH